MPELISNGLKPDAMADLYAGKLVMTGGPKGAKDGWAEASHDVWDDRYNTASPVIDHYELMAHQHVIFALKAA